MSYSHLVTRSGTAKKSSFHDRLAFMKVRCTGLIQLPALEWKARENRSTRIEEERTVRIGHSIYL